MREPRNDMMIVFGQFNSSQDLWIYLLLSMNDSPGSKDFTQHRFEDFEYDFKS